MCNKNENRLAGSPRLRHPAAPSRGFSLSPVPPRYSPERGCCDSSAIPPRSFYYSPPRPPSPAFQRTSNFSFSFYYFLFIYLPSTSTFSFLSSKFSVTSVDDRNCPSAFFFETVRYSVLLLLPVEAEVPRRRCAREYLRTQRLESVLNRNL